MIHVQQVPVVLVAALALFDQSGRVLLAQRPEGKTMAGLWELPGGKIEAGEVPEHALCREIHEELGLVLDPRDLSPLTFASHAYPDFNLLMPVWAADRWTGAPMAREGQAGLAWGRDGDLGELPNARRRYSSHPIHKSALSCDGVAMTIFKTMADRLRQAVAHQDRGATAIEYALIASLIALVLITSLGLLGTELTGFFDMVAVEMATPAPGR